MFIFTLIEAKLWKNFKTENLTKAQNNLIGKFEYDLKHKVLKLFSLV